MFVCCECCVLSGRGLCNELITRPEESYRLWCVIVCNLENKNLKNEEAMTRVGSQRHRKIVKYITNTYLYVKLIKFHANDCVPAAIFIVYFCKKNRDILTVRFNP